MSNPYLDSGYSMPYQISQNKYKEQVFGSRVGFDNYPQARPGPLDGRKQAPNNLPRPRSFHSGEDRDRRAYPYSDPYQSPRHDQHLYRQDQHQAREDHYQTPRQDPYQSPRHDPHHSQGQNNYQSPRHDPYQQDDHIQNQMTYRSGRPDIGFASKDVYVPYPQEPLRRRNEYMMPPEIGPHPGWVLLLRFHVDGESQVRRALTMCQKHIDSDGGRILGLARPHGIRIREGGDSWVTFGKMRHFGGGNWEIQQSPTYEETNYSVLAIYYPSLSRAIQWFDRDSWFKQKDFPPPYSTDCIVLPLNSSVDNKYCKTLVFTEYPRISHPEYFREKFSIPTEDMMRKRFRCSPYVVKASSIPMEDPRHRVARHLRGCWIKRNSVITLSMFDSLAETHRYFTDPEYLKCKEAQEKVSAPTTVIFDLEDWRM